MKKTQLFFLVLGILVILMLIFFFKNPYKKQKNGNNHISLEEQEQYIFNIRSYEAIAEVTIQSNKNVNQYLLKQTVKPQESKQEVLEPQNIQGVEMKYQNGSLIIQHTKFHLQKIYQEYPYLSKNALFLTDFISKFQEAQKNHKTQKQETEDEIIYTISSTEGKQETLYVNKKENQPSKIIIKDQQQKEKIYISYKEINIDHD